MFVSVAVPIPALPLLTYRVPPGCAPPFRGARVLVPLGTRTVTGLVVSTDVAAAEGDVKDLIEVLDDEPFLPDAIVDLALWVSDYYLAGPGDTLAAAMPPGAWVESQRRYRLTAAGRAALRGGQTTGRAAAGADPSGEGPEDTCAGAPTRRLASLERDGLIERVTTMTGRARAFRTTVIATLTPAGASLAARPERHARCDAGRPPAGGPRGARWPPANPRSSARFASTASTLARCDASRAAGSCTCTRK